MWALVHSSATRNKTDIKRGLELAESMLDGNRVRPACHLRLKSRGWQSRPTSSAAMTLVSWTLSQVEEQWQRDLVYLCAVAKFKLGSYLAARDQLAEILKVRCCMSPFDSACIKS